jgi:hypothetical protein
MNMFGALIRSDESRPPSERVSGGVRVAALADSAANATALVAIRERPPDLLEPDQLLARVDRCHRVVRG